MQYKNVKDGIEITEDKEMANSFNNCFGIVGSKLASVFNNNETVHICPTLADENFQFSYV